MKKMLRNIRNNIRNNRDMVNVSFIVCAVILIFLYGGKMKKMLRNIRNNIRNNRDMVNVSFIVCAVILIFLWGGYRVVALINFDRNCGGYLKRAADTNTIKLAKTQLEKAITYMEREGLTEGYTSILYRTPDEDIGFWYTNINTILKELRSLSAETTPLERSNMLIELRETLLDHTSEGTRVTIPDGISVYPANVPLAYGAWLLLILCVVFSIIHLKY